MSRMSVFALATVLTIGSLTTAVEVSARPGGHHGGSHSAGGSRGGGAPSISASRGASFGGVNRSFGVNRGFATSRSFGFRHGSAGWRGGRYYRPYLYAGYGGCYRWRQVWTPYGLQLRRVNICRLPYRNYGYYSYY